MTEKTLRRETARLIALGTLLFALLLALLLGLSRALPSWRDARAERRLAAGDTAAVRRLAGRMDDEARASELLTRCDYLDAQSLMAQRRWDEAAALLAPLGEWEDASALCGECRYQAALQAMEHGDLEEAGERFRALGAYRDAPELYAECRYRQALALEERGEQAEAAAIYLTLDDYRDARTRAGALCCAITGLRDAEAAMASFRGLSAGELERRAALAEARRALPNGCVAAGFYHTLGCRSDGRVLACGDDSFGQCRTEDWTDVVCVAAGGWHSLGLRRDGTVVAVGRDSEGQCEVSGWTQVIAIAAGDYASFALRADGTVLCAGFGSSSGTETWQRASAIGAGSYALGAVLSDGTAALLPDGDGGRSMTELVAIAVNTGCAVGLRSDGTLVSPQLALDGWQDMLAVTLSGTRLTGLDAHGHVRCLAFRASDAPELSGVENAAAIADGGTHLVIAFADGSVRVFGETDRGQGDTADWRLF